MPTIQVMDWQVRLSR